MSAIVNVSDYALDLLLTRQENDTDSAINRACNELGLQLSGDMRKECYDFIESELTGNIIDESDYVASDDMQVNDWHDDIQEYPE